MIQNNNFRKPNGPLGNNPMENRGIENINSNATNMNQSSPMGNNNQGKKIDLSFANSLSNPGNETVIKSTSNGNFLSLSFLFILAFVF